MTWSCRFFIQKPKRDTPYCIFFLKITRKRYTLMRFFGGDPTITKPPNLAATVISYTKVIYNKTPKSAIFGYMLYKSYTIKSLCRKAFGKMLNFWRQFNPNIFFSLKSIFLKNKKNWRNFFFKNFDQKKFFLRNFFKKIEKE